MEARNLVVKISQLFKLLMIHFRINRLSMPTIISAKAKSLVEDIRKAQ